MRALFGGDPMLISTGSTARLNSTTRTLTLYDAETGGAQVTDLLDQHGAAITTVTVTGAVVPPFYGPDGVVLLWADAGDGDREPMRGGYESPGRTDAELNAAIETGSAYVTPRARGALTISWDDAWEVWHSILMPRLMNNHPTQRHTFCLTPGQLDNTGGGYMTTAQAQELAANLPHCEFASHSQTHANMQAITAAERAVEFEQSKTNVEAITGRPCTTFVYPYGQQGRSITTDREAWLRYDRIVNAGQATGLAYTPMDQRLGMFLIPRSEQWESARHQDRLNDVYIAASQPVIVNMYGHRPGVNMTVEELDELLTLIDDLGVPVINISEAYPAGGLLTNPGGELGTSGWRVEGPGALDSVTDTPMLGIGGTHSLKVSNGSDTTSTYAHQTVVAKQNTAYTLSGRFRANVVSGDAAGWLRLRVTPLDQFGDTIASATSYNIGSETSGVLPWGRHEVALTTPAGTSAVRCDVVVQSITGDIWFDHLHFGETAWGTYG